jgi:hypothetical protein
MIKCYVHNTKCTFIGGGAGFDLLHDVRSSLVCKKSIKEGYSIANRKSIASASGVTTNGSLATDKLDPGKL